MSQLITIGIPAFNRPAGLRNTLKAICGQSYLNTEILVSDNCSTGDGVEQVAREFCNRDARVKYYRQSKNLGVYRNCEFLANTARGELFMIASDDDGWDIDYVEKLAGLLDRDARAILAISSVFYRRGDSVDDFDSEEKMGDEFDRYSEPSSASRILWHLASDWDRECHFFYGLIRTKFAKLAFSEVLSTYEHPIATDLQIVLHLICNGPVVVSRNTKKYYYIGDTISANFKFSCIEIVKKYFNDQKIIRSSNGISKIVKYRALLILFKNFLFNLGSFTKGKISSYAVTVMKLLHVHKFYQSIKYRFLLRNLK